MPNWSVLLCSALAVLPVVGMAATPIRVLVTETARIQISDSSIDEIPASIVAEIGKRAGYSLVADAERRQELSQRLRDDPDCLTSDECLITAGRDLHSDLVVASVVRREGKAYILELRVLTNVSQLEARSTQESMHALKSLRMNVGLCVERLFPMTAPPPNLAPPPVMADVKASPGPAAPVAQTVPAGAPPKKRVLVVDLEAIGVPQNVVVALPDLIARQIGVHDGYDVTSPSDLRRLSAFQNTKQQNGGEGDAAALARTEQQLNTDLMVNGSVGKVGDRYLLSLSVIDQRNVQDTQRTMETADRIEELPDRIPEVMARLFRWDKNARSTYHLPRGKTLSFAIMDLRPEGLSPEVAANLTQVLSVEVKGVEGASVVGHADIAALVNLEKAKQQVGCSTDECMAEVGGALGVDRLISGDVGKLGSTFLINLRIMNIHDGSVENRSSETFEGDDDQLIRAVREATRRLLGIEASGSGKLAITSNEDRSDVFVDHEKKGATPFTMVDLSLGRHHVLVERPGYFDWHGDVYVDPFESASIFAQLKERPQPWYQKWWVWTIAGSVVAGGVTAITVVTLQNKGSGTVDFPK